MVSILDITTAFIYPIKMTLKEIEAKLGYSIELVNEKESE